MTNRNLLYFLFTHITESFFDNISNFNLEQEHRDRKLFCTFEVLFPRDARGFELRIFLLIGKINAGILPTIFSRSTYIQIG